MSVSITPAQKRALQKAVANGFIMRPGGFCPENPLRDALETPDFDNGVIIDRLIGLGLLKHGEGANQFVPTQTGIAEATYVKPALRKKVAA